MIFESKITEAVVTKPLFPLPLVVFPGGRLPLQIFEARYLDMIGDCMRDGTSFVVTMSRAEGFADLGCEVSIRDFDQLSNGLLGILAVGVRKMQLFNPTQQDSGLWIADAAERSPESAVEVPDECLGLVELLKSLQLHPAVRGLYSDIDYTDASELGGRLTELLPFENERKQELFEFTDPLSRLREIEREVAQLQMRGRDGPA
jgi:Lon protease-like protein